MPYLSEARLRQSLEIAIEVALEHASKDELNEEVNRILRMRSGKAKERQLQLRAGQLQARAHDYRERVETWLIQNTKLDPDSFETSESIYNALPLELQPGIWRSGSGRHSLTGTLTHVFGEHITRDRKRIKYKKNAVRGWRGIKLKEVAT